MALDLGSVKTTLDDIQALLNQVSGATPEIIAAVKGLAAQGLSLVDTIKNEVGQLVGQGNMTEAETLAALERASAGLKEDIAAVDSAPRTGQATP